MRAWSAGFDPGLSPSTLAVSLECLKVDIKSVHPLLDVEAFSLDNME